VTAPLLLAFVLAYFVLLLAVAWRTSRRADNASFFIGNRSSAWGLVAFGMVGTSLSGVTFVSVPGAVGSNSFHYLQVVIGQFLGHFILAFVLLPLYYRWQLSSIYGYLSQRLGPQSGRTGAGIFIVSRTLGATARLYLVVKILQDSLLAGFGVPFWLTAAVLLMMILLYTFEGGVKTIVWTDTLQTAGMLTGLVVCVLMLLGRLDVPFTQSLALMQERGLADVFVTDPFSASFFGKQVLAGIFITVAMMGLDQEMMQKSLSVKTLRDSQKNIIVLGFVLLGVVSLFLYLGGLLHLYATSVGLQASGDKLFPAVVLGYLPLAVQVLFVIALISALFPSADGALTALTSSFCIDLLGMQERSTWSEAHRQRIRKTVHLAFAAVFMALVMVFRWVDDPSMIGLILKIAAYTYGPLLGLFAFGVLTQRQVIDSQVPRVALLAPALCWLLEANQAAIFGRWQLGLELLLLNGALTFVGLLMVSRAAAAGDLLTK
jgi:Na+/proline symporter